MTSLVSGVLVCSNLSDRASHSAFVEYLGAVASDCPGMVAFAILLPSTKLEGVVKADKHSLLCITLFEKKEPMDAFLGQIERAARGLGIESRRVRNRLLFAAGSNEAQSVERAVVVRWLGEHSSATTWLERPEGALLLRPVQVFSPVKC